MSVSSQFLSTYRPSPLVKRGRTRTTPALELLETRQVLSAANPLAGLTAQSNLTILPFASTGPSGYSPTQIQTAYGVNQISLSGAISGSGAGQTIAIVDAYNDPNIAADLAKFDKQFGLSAPPSFTVKNLGATTTNAGWALETSLDVEWAHALAPKANIVLVEAASSSLTSLFSAVGQASNLAGVSVVSMSWGTPEFWGEWQYDSVFTTPAGHAPVTFVASSGDSGAWYGPMYPSVSPNVLAVGGTSLTLGAKNAYGSETGWSGSTGGFSGTDYGFFFYETAPGFQVNAQAAVGLNYGIRTTPDVSFNADPSTGVAVYDSVPYSGQSGWFQVGGTSAAAPAWAGLVAIADQGLAAAGKPTLSTTQLQSALYSLPSSDFHDVTTGSNGYSATPGYDLVTGLGSPVANLLIPGILAAEGVTASSIKAAVNTTVGASTNAFQHAVEITGTGTITGPIASSGSSVAASTMSASTATGVAPIPATATGSASITTTNGADPGNAGGSSTAVAPGHATDAVSTAAPASTTAFGQSSLVVVGSGQASSSSVSDLALEESSRPPLDSSDGLGAPTASAPGERMAPAPSSATEFEPALPRGETQLNSGESAPRVPAPAPVRPADEPENDAEAGPLAGVAVLIGGAFALRSARLRRERDGKRSWIPGRI